MSLTCFCSSRACCLRTSGMYFLIGINLLVSLFDIYIYLPIKLWPYGSDPLSIPVSLTVRVLHLEHEHITEIQESERGVFNDQYSNRISIVIQEVSRDQKTPARESTRKAARHRPGIKNCDAFDVVEHNAVAQNSIG